MPWNYLPKLRAGSSPQALPAVTLLCKTPNENAPIIRIIDTFYLKLQIIKYFYLIYLSPGNLHCIVIASFVIIGSMLGMTNWMMGQRDSRVARVLAFMWPSQAQPPTVYIGSLDTARSEP